MDKIWKALISLGVIVGMVLGSINYFAKASDLSELINIITRKELRDELKTVNDRIWGYEEIDRATGSGH